MAVISSGVGRRSHSDVSAQQYSGCNFQNPQKYSYALWTVVVSNEFFTENDVLSNFETPNGERRDGNKDGFPAGRKKGHIKRVFQGMISRVLLPDAG